MKKIASFTIILLCLATSCSDKGTDPIVNPTPTPTPVNPSPTPTGSSYLSRIEVPKTESGNIFIQHSTKEGNDSVMSYCLEYNPKKFHSRWVAFRFDATTVQKNAKRPDVDPFIDDPSLDKAYYIQENGFGNTYTDMNGNKQTFKMDRGHLCASADRLYSASANEQTFYMTNMSPQLNSFNQHYWIAFEQFVQDYPRIKNNGVFVMKSTIDTLYVVKGGTIADDQILGYVSRNNGANVVIPKYYYIALLCKTKNGNYKALAFFMEHKEYGFSNSGQDISTSEMKKSIITIDELEKYTGIDFFHNLPDDIENKVEAECDPALWGL